MESARCYQVIQTTAIDHIYARYKQTGFLIITKIGPLKSLKMKTEKGDSSCALISMVRRLDSKKLVKEFDNQYLMGSVLKVEEIRPARNIKYMKQPKYEWKKAFPELYKKSLDC